MFKILVNLKLPQGYEQPFCNLACQHYSSDMHVIAIITWNMIVKKSFLMDQILMTSKMTKVTSNHFEILVDFITGGKYPCDCYHTWKYDSIRKSPGHDKFW